jgi:hypothetical protein
MLYNVRLILLHLGFLSFQWPCGIVINIAEMFNCESKSQVYGHLHELMERDNMSAVSKLYTCTYSIWNGILAIQIR